MDKELISWMEATTLRQDEFKKRLEALEQKVNALVLGKTTIAVNHDYGGEDTLQAVVSGKKIENANIYAYLKSDWEAGHRTSNYCKGWSMTGADGRWSWSMYLEPGVYYLIIDAPGYEQKAPIVLEVR